MSESVSEPLAMSTDDPRPSPALAPGAHLIRPVKLRRAGESMDIHKPKPVRSWREFASEIAVITQRRPDWRPWSVGPGAALVGRGTGKRGSSAMIELLGAGIAAAVSL